MLRHARFSSPEKFKFQFVGEGRQPMRHVLLPTNCCPTPLDSELLRKFQFIILVVRRN